jgi:amidase
VSARSAVAEALARIDADRSASVVTVARDAPEEAEELDRARSAGPLAGVPFTVKDVIATAGLRTTAASRALSEHVPERDAPAVARLREAGAVLVGKTNCSELALSAWTGNPLFPETRHPLDGGRSPGGSSGGCAAAIAAGLVPLSLGTDYGGSIRFPAACCGVVGLRPTPGRIPSAGQVPAPDPDSPRAEFSLVGPLGRTVHDVSAAFEVLAGRSRRGSTPPRAVALADGPSTAAVHHAADALRAAGLEVVVARMPWLREAASTFSALRALDTYDDLRPLADLLGPALQEHIAAAPVAPDAARREMLEHERAQLAEAALSDLGRDAVLILPIADCAIPPPAGRAVDLERLWPARAISLLGLPAVAIAGIQVVGPSHGDETVLAAAALIEPSTSPSG